LLFSVYKNMPFFVWQIHHLFFVILFLETESALKNLVASIDGER
jgi:hypothetical protein